MEADSSNKPTVGLISNKKKVTTCFATVVLSIRAGVFMEVGFADIFPLKVGLTLAYYRSSLAG